MFPSGTSIVVVGAGPVGCVFSALMAKAGHNVTLLERESELPRQLRASTFHPSTLDLLDELEVVEDLIEQGLIAPTFQYRDRQAPLEGRSEVVAEFSLELLGDAARHRFRLQCEQWRLCLLLLDRFANEPNHFAGKVDVRFGASVNSIRERTDSAGVHLGLADGSFIDADWVLAADGASSSVRKTLGVAFDGLTYEDRYLVVSTPVDLADSLRDLAAVNYVSDPEDWMVILRTRSLWRVLFPIPPQQSDADALSDQHIESRMQSVATRAEPYPIEHRTVYSVHQRVASTFRIGRVLLAGDAAHINNPLGGMGMNGGIHDAFVFAGALIAVLAGDSDDSLLDECATLRQRLAVDYVQAQTHANAITLATPDLERRRTSLNELAAIANDPERARAYVRRASMVEAIDLFRAALPGVLPPMR